MRINKIVTRTRLEAAGVAAAFALVVGLSAPAANAGQPNADPVTAHGGLITVGSTRASGSASGPGESPDTAGQSSANAIADAAASAVANAVAPAPNDAELHPVAVTAAQQQFMPSVEQVRNAKAIVEAGKAMNLPPRAWTIAVATSLQESNLRNLGNLGSANDHDSLGLFQQRPSSGWGSPSQVQDPTYAAKAFYRALVQVPGWDSLPLTVAAQKVQVSAFPDHYAKHETEAGDIIEALYGQGPYADVAAQA